MLDTVCRGKAHSIAVTRFLSFAVMAVLMTVGADAQELNCADFQRVANGSWTPIRQIAFPSPDGNVLIGPGNAFNPGVPFKGIDFATLLNAKCG